MTGGATITALVLAGSRGGDDSVARAAGLAHKALVHVGGRPMLARVIDALRESPTVGRVAVSADERLVRDLDASTAEMIAGGGIQLLPTGARPSETVELALKTLVAPYPLLVTTADHALLTPKMVEHFCKAAPEEADVAVGVARAGLVERAYPGAVRTYYGFGAERYSSCNLYLFRTPAARQVTEFWGRLERHRKRPWRMVAAIGVPALLRFALGRISLADALALLSHRVGARVAAVEMPFAEAAIDVDKPADLALAEQILAGRL